MEILLSFTAIVLSIIALSRTNDFSLKIAKLEKMLNDGKIDASLGSKAVQYVNSSLETSVSKEKYEEVQEVSPVVSEQVDTESAFVTWLKEDWLLKLGGILILMGVLFFLSLAYTAVGPQGKIAIGYIFGASLMIFGFKYAKKEIIGGGTIHVIGAIVILITTYLARQPGYDLFDTYFAALLMLLTTVCVSLTAYAYNRPQLAHVGLFLAGIVPMLTNSQSNNFTELLMYLGVVTLGTLWLALITKWRTLVLLALGIVSMYSLMKLTGGMGATTVSFIESYILVVFGILFYVTSLFAILRARGVTQPVDGAVAVLNAGFALMWITTQVSHEIAPMVIALVSFVYALGFFFVYKITDAYTSFVVYGSVSLGLLTTAVMLQLSGRSEIVVLLLIGAAVTFFTYYLSGNKSITKTVALFNILPLIYVFKTSSSISWPSYSSVYSNSASMIPWSDVGIVLLAIAVYFVLCGYFRTRIEELWQISLFAGFSFSVTLIWQILHLIIANGFATFLSILIYVGIGLLVLFFGVEERNFTKIRLAKLWLGLVASHVIFWDAWQVGDIIFGVLICIVIGILLLSSTFILKKVIKE